LPFLVAGMIAYRRDLGTAEPRDAFPIVVFGPAFVAAALAAFAGEHFTIAKTLAGLVPKWMPGRLFIAYFRRRRAPRGRDELRRATVRPVGGDRSRHHVRVVRPA
jgi:hypothetical protein